MPHAQHHKLEDFLLLVVWLAIGNGLRLTRLATKPPWTDEFSTVVFSLGNSFLSVPLDRAIALDVLLQPMQPRLNVGVADVVQHLLSESNHPPLYFVLAHYWMQLWPPDSVGLASVWAARALPALLGAASVPAIYMLSWFAFRSRLVGQMAAAIMAVSPYGIFLAQEARHYTLAILWVIASLSCLAIAIQHIQIRQPLPAWVALVWVFINAMGVSTHYLFALTLCAEAMILIKFWIAEQNPKFWGIYSVAVGTLVVCLVWLPVFLQNSHGGELTQWIRNGNRVGLAWLNPVFQAFAAWLTMLYLLPVEAPALPVVLVSGLVMLVFLIWALPILIRGFKTQLRQPASRLMTQLFAGVVCSAIALFFFFTYAFGIDLTRGARYSFVYFPSVIILLGASLAACWNSNGKRAVMLIWLMGLLSGLTVVCNLGYQKYYRPDLLVQLIQQTSHSPVLIATTHKTHVQTGEMMGIARELKVSGSPVISQFLLAHQDQPNTSTRVLEQTLSQLPRPLDLWLVNFHAPVGVNDCVGVPLSSPPVNGYEYKLYRCSIS